MAIADRHRRPELRVRLSKLSAAQGAVPEARGRAAHGTTRAVKRKMYNMKGGTPTSVQTLQ